MKPALFAALIALAVSLHPEVCQSTEGHAERAAVGAAVNTSASSAVTPAQIHTIIMQRCAQCHAEHPTMMGSPAAGIRLDSDAAIDENAATIYQQTVVWQSMPLNNATGMTPAERAMVARWYMGGGKP